MTLWIAYTARGREFDTAEEAETLGLWAIVPRKVELIRQGKRRRPDAITSPYLDNYVFTEADAQGWHWLRASKHVRTIMAVPEAERAAVMRFIDRVEADYAARMAQIQSGERVSQYNPGDLLEILGGAFVERLAEFSRIAEGSNGFPIVWAKTQMFGREVEIPIDPLNVRLAFEA